MAGELFSAYRYFVVSAEQLSLFSDRNRSGKEVINELLAKCETDKKLVCNIRGQKHLLIHQVNYTENISLYKFSKDIPKVMHQFDETKEDIVKVLEDDNPYIFAVIDRERQLVLLTHNHQLFQKREATKNALKLFISTLIFESDFVFSMDEIVYADSFWGQIKDAESIYEVSFNLRSPNLFNGIFETNKFLKQLKETYNNSETQMKLKNEKGKLLLKEENLDDTLQYVENGGGTWSASVIKRGNTKRTTITSKSGIKTVEISNFENEYNIESSRKNILQAIDEVDKLSLRGKEAQDSTPDQIQTAHELIDSSSKSDDDIKNLPPKKNREDD